MFGGGGAVHWHPPGAPGGPGHLHGAMDAEDDDVLGKVYDRRVIRRLPRYMAWVKGHMAVGITGTVIRTGTTMAMPYLVKMATDQLHDHRDGQRPDHRRSGLRRRSRC